MNNNKITIYPTVDLATEFRCFHDKEAAFANGFYEPGSIVVALGRRDDAILRTLPTSAVKMALEAAYPDKCKKVKVGFLCLSLPEDLWNELVAERAVTMTVACGGLWGFALDQAVLTRIKDRTSLSIEFVERSELDCRRLFEDFVQFRWS